MLNKLQGIPVENFDDAIRVQAVKLQTVLTDFLRESIVWLRKHYGTKIFSTAVGLQDLVAAKSTLKTARDNLRTSLSDDLYLTLKWRDLEQRNKEILDCMCTYGDHTFHLGKQSSIHKRRLDNTGTGIVDDPEYMNWHEGKISTLWCSGLAGAGKTFAASAVIDDLELRTSSSVGLAFYYCQFDRRGKQNSESIGENVLGAITRQLLARNPALIGRVPIHGQFPTFEERKRLFLATVDALQVVFIVVDAMDEFSSNHDERIELGKLFVELRDDAGPHRLQILITSREADDIFEDLSPATKIPIRASESEIRHYVEHTFPRLERAKKLVDQDPSLLAEVASAIVIKSGRM